MAKPVIDLATRFWAKVSRGASSECWEWNGATVSGYGFITLTSQRRQEYAHRVAWKLTYGEIENGMLVCHKCDNRKCCNPNHLFLGTFKDNTQDMLNKGRSAWQINPPPQKVKLGQAKGERIGQHKLSESSIVLIRQLYREGTTQAALSRQFKVSPSAICRAISKFTWKHIE